MPQTAKVVPVQTQLPQRRHASARPAKMHAIIMSHVDG